MKKDMYDYENAVPEGEKPVPINKIEIRMDSGGLKTFREMDRMEPINKIDVETFRRLGYLQELNRQFLHPLGLALEVKINSEGEETLGGIWDYQDDKEGITYGNDFSNDKKAYEKARYVKRAQEVKAKSRKSELGYVIQPIGDIDKKPEIDRWRTVSFINRMMGVE